MITTPIPCTRKLGIWGPYLAKTDTRPPSCLAIEALEHVRQYGAALDLGAGTMKDSEYLLRHGFRHVTAVDASPDAVPYAQKIVNSFGPERFGFSKRKFSEFPFEPESMDLVHSHFALPYHGAVGFTDLMEAVTGSVKVGGVLSIILFGTQDEWMQQKPDLAFVTRSQIECMLCDFHIMTCREMTFQGRVYGGEDDSETRTKLWNYFRVLARRIQPVL